MNLGREDYVEIVFVYDFTNSAVFETCDRRHDATDRLHKVETVVMNEVAISVQRSKGV